MASISGLSPESRALKFEKNNRSTKLTVTYNAKKEFSFTLTDMITNEELAYGSMPVKISRDFAVSASKGNKKLILTCKD